MNSWFQVSPFRKKFAILILPEQFGIGGVLLWHCFGTFELQTNCQAKVVLLSCSFLCWLWYLCGRGAGADWDWWFFWGGEDVPCPFIPDGACFGFRWVLEVQWGLSSRTQNVVLLLEIIYERIYTVPIRCKHCETSWWEVMLYFYLSVTFWRLTPLKVVFFCLLCFSEAFVIFCKTDLAKTISGNS